MTASQKYQAFQAVVKQVRAIESRHTQEKAQAIVAARYAEYEQQRNQARKDGGFCILK